jgi:ABC-type taurine transport system substrate-binding protein
LKILARVAPRTVVVARLDRAIQYSGNSRFVTGFPAYWIPAFEPVKKSSQFLTNCDSLGKWIATAFDGS